MYYNDPRGSMWRKWDLQVCTNKYTDYKGITLVSNEIKKMKELTDLESSKINSDHSSLTNEEYARLFVEYLVNFTDISVVSITNHNTGEGIQEILNYLQSKQDFSNVHNPYNGCSILPGVEIGASDRCHILIVFNPNTTNKHKFKYDSNGSRVGEKTWEEYIKEFLKAIDIPEARFDQGKPQNSSSKNVLQILDMAEEWDFIPIFPHINNNDGWWRELQESNRKETYSHEKFRIVDSKSVRNNRVLQKILNGKHKEYGEKYIAQIYTSDAKSLTEIGNNFTWIKADPTFEGLKQIIYEPEERVFIGDEPELLNRVRENKTKFIKAIKINHVEGYDGKNGIWFKDIEIPLNPGMVTIIGHKGTGKSALLDIISLCGNSHQKDFSFLNEDRFKKGGLAKNFEAVLEWEGGEPERKNLNDITDKTAPEKVKYLPQDYFERLTSSPDNNEFKETLDNVVFNHLPKEQKLGKNSFNELISYKKEIIDYEISSVIKDIELYNEKIIALEKKERPDYLEKMKNELIEKKEELAEHEKNKPKKVDNPQEENENIKKLQKLGKQIEENEESIKNKNEENEKLLLEIEELKKIKRELENFEKEINNYVYKNQAKFKKYDLNSNDLIKIEINTQAVEMLIENKTNQRRDNTKEIKKIKENNKEIIKNVEKIRTTLSDQQRKYQKYVNDLKNWKNKKQKIIGDDKTPYTIKWYENEIKFIENNLKNEIDLLREERIKKSLEIYNKKKELVDIYKTLKDYVDKEISDYQNILEEYEINIEATLAIAEEFYYKFLSFINQKVKGTFRGEDEGLRILLELIKEINLTSKEKIKEFLIKIIDYLEYDQRKGKERRFVLDQISDKNIKEFYRYLFSLEYIDVIYQLKLGDKEISQLSPGEKGALLIIFYLMLDKNNVPLLIDQPEENLDNESIYKILTKFIRLAKQRRQLIMVTHNPNLAIVGDSEQIIYVNIDKKNGNKFSFESGSIENPNINKHASDILEGTLKAFDLRRLKYFNPKETYNDQS